MYFKIESGRIVTEEKVKLAYEIYSGHKADDVPYSFEKFVHSCPIKLIPMKDITVENLIEGDAFVDAVKLYKDQHRCTLREAKEACESIRDRMRGGSID